MGVPLLVAATDKSGALVSLGGAGAALAMGPTTPNGTRGHAPGGLFINTESKVVYKNDGNYEACSFTAVAGGSAIAADTISEFTAASGVTVDGVLLKDGGATLSGALNVATISEVSEGEGIVIDELTKFRGGRVIQYMYAPQAETGTSQSYTAAKIFFTGTITSTQTGAVSAALDSGTDMDTAIGAAVGVGSSFEWSVINLGSSSGAVTLQPATGHTIVGNAVVAISTSARFRTKRTATNTWVTYRL